MREASEFAQILEKMQRQDRTDGTASEKKNYSFTPPAPTEIFFTLEERLYRQIQKNHPHTTFSSAASQQALQSTLAKFTKHAVRPKSAASKEKTTKPEPVVALAAHLLNEGQQKSFDVLIQYDGSLSPAFTIAELKRCYRKLALQHHPDHAAQKRSETFIAIRAAYKNLLLVFTPSE